MKDAGDKLTADEKKPVEEAITELNKVKNGDDLEAIKKATENLSTAAQKIGESSTRQLWKRPKRPSRMLLGENQRRRYCTADAPKRG